MNTNSSLKRFITHLDRLQNALTGVIDADDVAAAVLKADVRTHVFMLEALCRIHRKLHNDDLFSSLNKRFKKVEDMIGSYDFYKWVLDESSGIEQAEKDKIEHAMQDAGEELVYYLKDEKWLSRSGKRINKIKAKLEDADWPSEEKFVTHLAVFYNQSISKIKGFITEHDKFTDVEEHVHELRRKIRWLSIYPHATLGVIQLNDNEDDSLKKYITAEVLSSKFNRFPAAETGIHLMLNRDNFYALSRTITELGNLKDEGLKLNAEENQPETQQILIKAKSVADTMVSDKVLENLVEAADVNRNISF